MANNAVKKKEFEKFLVFNGLSIKVVSIDDGYNELQVFYKGRLIADMNGLKGELDLDWAYEYIMDLSGSSYFYHDTKICKKLPEFRSIEEIKNIPIL